jgi:hypothetical protein
MPLNRIILNVNSIFFSIIQNFVYLQKNQRMKIKNICIALSFSIASFVSAQTTVQSQSTEKTDIETKAKTETSNLVNYLELTPMQEERVYEIHIDVLTKNEVIAKDADLTDFEKADYIRSNSDLRKELIKSILTEEQRSKYENLLNNKSNSDSRKKESDNQGPQKMKSNESRPLLWNNN